jgi:hypothetical protein
METALRLLAISEQMPFRRSGAAAAAFRASQICKFKPPETRFIEFIKGG